jgi:hypothetical protein
MKKTLGAGLAIFSLACAEPFSPRQQSLEITRATLSDIGTATVEAVLPSAYATMMGTSNNNFPHSVKNLRYQQVFLGSDLVDPTIIGLCLRRDDVASGAERTQTLTIKLGPTARDYTSLGSVFDDNYSAVPTQVFSGDVTIPASAGDGTPTDFDMCIPFSQSYEHSAGSNVIVEVINTSAVSGNVPRDACLGSETQCTTKRAYAFSATATTAFSVESGGLVMKFISPEPPPPPETGPGVPASKDECMNGGWSDFAFRNQGQCIRFVETAKDSRQQLLD